MTDYEKAVMMAFTGVCTLKGDKFNVFHRYLEQLYHKPIFTHEIPRLANDIKERSRQDFYRICGEHETLEQELVDIYNTMALERTTSAYIQFRNGIKVTVKIENTKGE